MKFKLSNLPRTIRPGVISTPPAPRPDRGYGGKFGLLLISLLSVFLIMEIVLRLTWHGAPKFKGKGNLPWVVASHTLGWVNRPGFTGRQVKPGAIDVAIAINANGVRGPERGYARTPGVRRILVVGDSFTFGHGVEYADTFSSRLEASLPATEVINGAIVGIGHDQQLRWLQEEGLKYKPDLVIWAFTSADIPRNTVSFMRTYDPETGLDFGKPRYYLEHGTLILGNTPVADPEEIPWLVAEHVADRLKERFFLMRFLVRHTALVRFITDRTDALKDRRDQLALARAIAHEFIRTTSTAGYPLLIAYLPVENWLARNDPLTALKRHISDKIIREVAAIEKTQMLDLPPVFKSVEGGDIHALFIPGDGHFSPRGHALVADALRRTLSDDALFKVRKKSDQIPDL